MSTQLNMMPEWPKLWTAVAPILPVVPHMHPAVRPVEHAVPVQEQIFSMTKALTPTYKHIMTQLYKLDAVVIPTNYRCVMGRGLARQMNRVFPGLDKMFLQITGRDATCVKGVMAPRPKVLHQAYLKPLHGKRKGLTPHHRMNPQFAKPKVALVYFPVKDDWMNNASIDIIRESVGKLKVWLEARPHFQNVALPKVGCGNGRLKWEIVRPALYPLLRMDQVRLYDYPTSTPIMHRDLLYDWIGSAQPHYRGNAEYEHLQADYANALEAAKKAQAEGRRTIYATEKRFKCTKYSMTTKKCLPARAAAYFDDNIYFGCEMCNLGEKKAAFYNNLKKDVEAAATALNEFNKTWADVEMKKIMAEHKEYKNNSLKRCASVILHKPAKDLTRSQKNYIRLHVRAKEVRIIYCAETRTQWGQPEIIGIIKNYLSYGAKVTVYDYREPEPKAYTGKAFLNEFHHDDTPDYLNKLVQNTEQRYRVANYLREFDYTDYPRPATVNDDDHTFVERHGHAVDFNKNEYDYVKSSALIPDVMSDKEIVHWLLQELYMKSVVRKTRNCRDIYVAYHHTEYDWHYMDVYASNIATREVEDVYRYYYVIPDTRVRHFYEQVKKGFYEGRELDNELFASDINPAWCYETGIGTACLEGDEESYGGDPFTDDVE